MEDKKLRQSLLSALQWASIRSLPEKDNGEHVWVYALGLVSKRDGSKGYVALSKGEDGENKVVKDFGSISQIAKIEEIYPYLYLDGNFLPDFKNAKKEDRIKWLSMNGVKGDLESKTAKELNKLVLCVAIKNHLKSLK